MSRLVVIIAGLLLLWALFEFGAVSKAPEIEQDIQARAAAAIADAGYDGVTVSADGRNLRLGGEVADQESVNSVADIANGVRGVREVDSDVAVAAPYITIFCKNEASISLSGEVPDKNARDAFPERARDMFRFFEIEDILQVRRHSLAGFRRFMDQALIELGQLDVGCITLTNYELLVKGSIRSERAAAGVKQRIDALDNLGFQARYELMLPVLSEQALTCQAESNNRISTHETVLFKFDSDVLHEIGRHLLDEVAEISQLCPDVDVVVVGHTDSVGDKEYNIGLGKRRAEAVVKYLVLKGVDAERLTPVGLGFSQPIADNSSDEGRAANRRIEIRAREN
jgi:outer membrane protein OmpA-like peptidoglycan-associated protein